MRSVRIACEMEALKVEQNFDYLFILYLLLLIYKSNKIKVGMNEIRANDSKMCMRWSLVKPEISVPR